LHPLLGRALDSIYKAPLVTSDDNCRRHHDIVHSSSSLAKRFFPDAHIQMRNKIRTDQGIAIAINWPKNSSEMK